MEEEDESTAKVREEGEEHDCPYDRSIVGFDSCIRYSEVGNTEGYLEASDASHIERPTSEIYLSERVRMVGTIVTWKGPTSEYLSRFTTGLNLIGSPNPYLD